MGAALLGVTGGFKTSIPAIVAYIMFGLSLVAFVCAIRDVPIPPPIGSRNAESAGPGTIIGYGPVSAVQLVPHQPDVDRKPVSLGLRPPSLAGREELLADLDTRLSGGNGPWPRVVALHGLGGVGKTSLAVEYAYRHLAEVGTAWRLDAEDKTVLTAGFGELAAQLGTRAPFDTRDQVKSVHAVLAAFTAGWLLVFDNALDLESVEEFLPPAGPGRVLITSQNGSWPGQALEVPPLAPDAAAEFLVDRTGDPDRPAAVELSGELGGLPLALEQAAAYIQGRGDSLASYLALFRQRRSDLLARGMATGHRGTVITTWTLAFGQLKHSTPSGAGLLRLLASCAPEAIPLRLLLQPRPGLVKRLHWRAARALAPLLENPEAAGDVIVALRRYSLIGLATSRSVSVNRLVQAITLDEMSANRAMQWRQATAAVIEAAIPQDPAQWDSWPDFAALLPHAQASLTADSAGLRRTAAYLGYSGSYAAARELYRRMLDEQVKVRGPDHPNTLAACANAAWWTGEAGDAAAARDQYAELVPVMKRVLGPDHPNTLAACANAAWWTGEAGDAAAARDQYAELVPVMKRVLGPDHPKTVTARANLAFWTGKAGDAAAARDQYAELVPVMKRVLGPDHPHALTARANRARWTGEAGDAAARDQYAELVPVMKRVLGPDHPNTLTTRGDRARWTGEAGDAAAARDQYAELLHIEERVLGPEHPDTLTTRVDLARWTGEAAGTTGPGVD